jgi:hypothetical protein
MTYPWDERAALEAAAQRLRGRTLERVAYLLPASTSTPEPRRRGAVEEADMGIELGFDGGECYRALWQQRGLDNGLAFGPADAVPAATMELVAVEASGAWEALLGRAVTEVTLASQVPEDGAREAVWAVRLAFGERSVLLALGTTLEDAPVAYQPDAVVAIFDARMADAYLSER